MQKPSCYCCSYRFETIHKLETMTSPLSQTANYAQDYSYVSKVFFYFGLAVLTSAAGTYTGFTYLAELFIANPISMYVLFAVELIIIFTSRLWAEKRPLNYLLFIAFSFITGVTIVPLLALFLVEFGPAIIIKALLATTCTFAATAIFGWVTKKNLSGMSGFLWAGLLGMIVVSVIGIFVPWGNTFEMVFAGIGVVLFSAFTMYDIQRIKMMQGMSPMEAALNLYLDLFNLFIYILRLMGAVSRD